MQKERIKKRWIHHRNLLARGHTEVSLFYSTIQMAILIWLFLRDLMSFSRFWIFVIAPACAILVILIQYLVGYMMDRYGMIHELQEWDFERNPMVMKILEIVSHEKQCKRDNSA